MADRQKPTQIPMSLYDRIGYRASDMAIRFLIWAICLLPYRTRLQFIGWLMAYVAGPLAGFRRRIRQNLSYVEAGLTEEETHAMCINVPKNIGRSFIEMYSGDEFLHYAHAAPLHGPGLAALRDAQAKGRPMLIVTGHFGNYNAARARFKHEGIELGGLYRRMANPYYNEHYVQIMETISEPLFEQGRKGMSQMVRHLKAGGTIAILTDVHVQNTPFLSFFGKPARTSTIPAELALKYDALILPVYGIRKEDGLNFDVYVDAPIEGTDAAEISQEINDRLEAQVRAHMDQWFWVHKLWKPYKS